MPRLLALQSLTVILVAALTAQSAATYAQETAPPPPRGQALESQLDQLARTIEGMRRQLIDSQAEMEQLRMELRDLRQALAQRDRSGDAAEAAASLRAGIAQLQSENDVIQAEVKQHDQTKVESLSKYAVRIGGALLVTSILNSRSPDNIDAPIIAQPDSESGSLSATASQSMLQLEAFGPHLWGARSSADLAVDFWGDQAYGSNAAGAATLRLRTLHARLEWPRRSAGFALDRPLIAPWQPTSWMTLAAPALAWSGNLWVWSPQLEFTQHGLASNPHLDLALGLIDPSPPPAYTAGAAGEPSGTERSRQPGYEMRIGSEVRSASNPIRIGASGYYSRQSYNYDHHVNAWAAAVDWDAFVTHALEISGQVYRGLGIAGLGSGAFKDYVTYNSYRAIRGLDAAGGWTQATFSISSSLQVNLSAGLDNASAHQLRGSDQQYSTNSYASLARNQTVLANVIYRPRTYLLLSGEFRRISSWPITGSANRDRVLGLATGYIF